MECVPDRPQYQLLAAKSNTWITTSHSQYYGMFYSPSAPLLVHFYHPGAVQEHFPKFISSPSFHPRGYMEMCGGHADCVRLIFGVPVCVSTSLSWQLLMTALWNYQSDRTMECVHIEWTWILCWGCSAQFMSHFFFKRDETKPLLSLLSVCFFCSVWYVYGFSLLSFSSLITSMNSF